MIKGILFDFDDTIGDRKAYSYITYKELIETFCDINDPFEKECVLQDMMLWDMKGNYDKNFILENLKKKYHLTVPIENLNKWWVEHQWKHTVTFKDVIPVLERLHQNYQLALVTNGNDTAQRQKVHRARLENCFDVLVTSGQVGKKKPEPDGFQLALKKLDIRVDEAVYVGDTFSTDMIGAHRLGMRVIWVMNQDWPCSIDIPRISHIKELLEVEWPHYG